MITVSQHEVVKESFPQVFQGIIRGWEHDTLKLLKRGTGDEREASDLVPRDFPLEIGKTLGTRLEKLKWGMMGTCAERERGEMGSGGGRGVVLFLPFPTLPSLPLSIIKVSVVCIKMH